MLECSYLESSVYLWTKFDTSPRQGAVRELIKATDMFNSSPVAIL